MDRKLICRTCGCYVFVYIIAVAKQSVRSEKKGNVGKLNVYGIWNSY